jgi:hypothetical protein
MRVPASLTSSTQSKQLPAGLIQRLEMMQQLALQAKAEADGQQLRAEPGLPPVAGRGGRRPRRAAQVIILAWFSLGVVGSGAAGFGALTGLRALEARGTPLTWASLRGALGATLTSAWATMPPVALEARPAVDGPWDRLEIKVDSSQRARAPLGLQVTGGDGRPVVFVLDGLPKGVRPSHGAPVGPGTWVVGAAEIAVLHLALDEGAPSAFDLKIALLAPTGVAKSGSVVQVRMVNGAAPQHTDAGKTRPTEAGAVALATATKTRE